MTLERLERIAGLKGQRTGGSLDHRTVQGTRRPADQATPGPAKHTFAQTKTDPIGNKGHNNDKGVLLRISSA